MTDRLPAESMHPEWWMWEYPARMEAEEAKGRDLHMDCREIGCVDCWKAQSATDRGLSAECESPSFPKPKTL